MKQNVTFKIRRYDTLILRNFDLSIKNISYLMTLYHIDMHTKYLG